MLIPNILVILFALSLGSFANYLIWRLYKGESLKGRSHCPRCHHSLSWYDNIPLLSFILLRGRCRHCRQKISWQYPLVELSAAILFLLVFWRHLPIAPDWLTFNPPLSFYLGLLRDWIFVWLMLVVFVFDLRFYLVPMSIVAPLGFALFLLDLFLVNSLSTFFLAAVAVLIFFAAQFFLTKKKGIGEGDIWLGLLLVLGLPQWRLSFLAILSAYIIGSVVGVALIAIGKKSWGSRLPLGVFLALGALLAYFFGSDILAWYQSILIVNI